MSVGPDFGPFTHARQAASGPVMQSEMQEPADRARRRRISSRTWWLRSHRPGCVRTSVSVSARSQSVRDRGSCRTTAKVNVGPRAKVYVVATLLGQGRRGDAVRLRLRLAGAHGPVVALMRCMPAWRKFKAVAHTSPTTPPPWSTPCTVPPLPAGRWSEIALPVLAVVGGNSPAWIHHGVRALADVLPKAEHRILDGQTHMVKPNTLAPMLTEFFTQR